MLDNSKNCLFLIQSVQEEFWLDTIVPRLVVEWQLLNVMIILNIKVLLCTGKLMSLNSKYVLRQK